MRPKVFFASLAVLIAAAFSGCASDSPPPVGATKTNSNRHPETLFLKITGGADAAISNAAQVSRPAFLADVTKSLHQAALFQNVVSTADATSDYQLEIAIADLQPPDIGASMTATVESTWTLTRTSNRYQIWQKKISSSHTTDSREAFTGVERLKLAIEGAAHANVQDGITELGNIALP